MSKLAETLRTFLAPLKHSIDKKIERSDIIDKADKNDIPTMLSQLTEDAAHRTVSDSEIFKWNNKSDFDGKYNSLTNRPTIYTDVVRYDHTQSLTDAQKETARTNMGAGTSSFDGSYNSLSDAPEIIVNTEYQPLGGRTYEWDGDMTERDCVLGDTVGEGICRFYNVVEGEFDSGELQNVKGELKAYSSSSGWTTQWEQLSFEKKTLGIEVYSLFLNVSAAAAEREGISPGLYFYRANTGDNSAYLGSVTLNQKVTYSDNPYGMPSSTPDSDKRFSVSIDDTGTITATNMDDATEKHAVAKAEDLFSGSYPDLTEKPVSAEPKSINIEWDGTAPEGVDSFTIGTSDIYYYKFSDEVPDPELITSAYAEVSNGKTGGDILYGTNCYQITPSSVAAVLVVTEAGAGTRPKGDSFTAPSTGVYLYWVSDKYTSKCQIEYEVVEQLDEKFIPDTIARVEDIPEGFSGSWNDLSDRPFGDVYESTTLIENHTFNIILDGQGNELTYNGICRVDMPLRVIWDGTTYNVTPEYYDSNGYRGYIAGSSEILEGTYIGSGCPFVIFELDGAEGMLRTVGTGEHTISIYQEGIVAKVVEEKYIPEEITRTEDLSEVATSGAWQDLTDKPFGETETSTTLVENHSFTALNDDEVCNDNPLEIELVDGKEYIVTFDGVEYRSTAVYNDQAGGTGIGNVYAIASEFTPTDDPFAYYVGEGLVGWEYLLWAATAGDHVITIAEVSAETQCIEEKYIPDTIQRVGDDVILNSSTSGSTKKFKITVDDSGTLTATEVTE